MKNQSLIVKGFVAVCCGCFFGTLISEITGYILK